MPGPAERWPPVGHGSGSRSQGLPLPSAGCPFRSWQCLPAKLVEASTPPDSGEWLAFPHELIRDAVQAAYIRHSFDDRRVKSGVTLTSVAVDRRLDIARTGDAWRHGTCHRCQEKCRSLRWCLADKTVARS
jgi:hypothetical protein